MVAHSQLHSYFILLKYVKTNLILVSSGSILQSYLTPRYSMSFSTTKKQTKAKIP